MNQLLQFLKMKTKVVKSLKTIFLSAILILIVFNAAEAQYVSGDTSVCRNQVETYTFAGAGPYIFTASGGTITGSTATTVTVKWGTVAGRFSISANDGTNYIQFVVIEGDIALACNDLVNVSLDGLCRAIITPSSVLEGETFPESSYSVIVYNTNGIPVPGNALDGSFLGKTLTVLIRHLCSGVSCWGKIFIEDKYIPSLICNEPDTINCGDDTDPFLLGFPLPGDVLISPHPNNQPNYFLVEGFDLCCDVTLNYTDVSIKYGCNATFYSTIYRKWIAADCKGNSSKCTDTIYVEQGILDSVNCPPNWDGSDSLHPVLHCDSIEPSEGPYPSGWNALDNGNPSPYDYYNAEGELIWRGTGFPTNVGCDHIAVTFRDLKIPVCGNAFKLLRNWKIFDWCTGEIIECTQLIKVVDYTAPIVTCPEAHVIYPTDYYECTATVTLPDPQLIIDCSPTTYIVEYKLADNDGNPVADEFRRDGITYKNGKATITGLPTGIIWVQYIVSDGCGNSSICLTDIIVEDNLDPVAICDEHTVVTLNEQGVAKLFATSVDNGSFDNCEIDSMFVRKMTDNCGNAQNVKFNIFTEFCCRDISHNPIMVVFRVKDKNGHFNDCMVSVTVQDKIAPEIICPDDITVQCGTDLSNLNLVGRPTANDACDSVALTYKDDTIYHRCGIGTFKRIWRATDLGGRFDICEQYITVVDTFNFHCDSVRFPKEITIIGCVVTDAHPDITGRPKYPQGPCNNIIAGYSDEKFYNIDGFCVKIIRHWKVIDWCLYDVNSPNSNGLCEADQVIKIRNTVAPILTDASCEPKEVCTDNANCTAFVELIAAATDDCTDPIYFEWKYTIDLDNNGTSDIVGTKPNASGFYKGGTHKIRWEVKDACGNIAFCNQIFTVKDCKLPTPFCKVGLITVVMPSTGSVTTWAKNFDEKSEDNCTPHSKLRFSFSPNLRDSFVTYSCADMPNGREVKIPVTVYVWDEAGNSNFCTTSLLLQDGIGNVCPDRFTNGGIVSGFVSANQNAALKDAKLDLVLDKSIAGTIKSINDGHFSFVDIVEGQNYELAPSKNDDVINGITTADIVLIQKHILGIQTFDSPYKYIAADVNNNKYVTASDISDLRRIILGLSLEFRNDQTSWRFIQSNFQFEEKDNPWSSGAWPETIQINNLQGEAKDKDFLAIKIGDLNYSAKTTDLNKTQSRTSEKLFFELEHQLLQAGQTYKVPVYGNWKQDIYGFQLSWKFDPENVQFVSLIPGVLSLSEDHISIHQLNQGVINMSWSSATEVQSNGQPLFYLEFTVQKPLFTDKLFSIHPDKLKAEAYNANLSIMDIELRSKENQETLDEVELYQNTPNPLSTETRITFKIPKPEVVNLSILDISGKTIWSKDIHAKPGLNETILTKQELQNFQGVMYYQLKASSKLITKKMIVLRN
ncbi:MAG: T9SS type A sorting domain-containing protein [Bacteroidota bacterium]|nr:T9SS type A sorting domain-containing protein [Bacteroidota bacterium]